MKSVPTKKNHGIGAALFAAAMALPLSKPVFAEAAPEHGIVAFKFLNYQDSQPGIDRMGINAYSVTSTMPFAGEWSIGTTYTYDSVSGASPSYHTAPQGFSYHIHDIRRAEELQLTRYFSRGTLTAGISYSKESDYISRSVSLQGSLSTEDKNTTVAFGGSYTNDDITALDFNERKRVVAGLFGVTKVLTKQDILQLNFGFSRGDGFFIDPYKMWDNRPRKRNSTTVLTRWNHHFDGIDGTTRIGYRYYTDSFDIKAHTLSAEYVQLLGNDWTATPSVRLHSQTAASFYVPVGAGELAGQEYATIPTGVYYTEDQRMSAFGALTIGIKVSKRIANVWMVDVKYEHAEQRPNWSITGGGDPGIAPFSFRSIQLGLSREL